MSHQAALQVQAMTATRRALLGDALLTAAFAGAFWLTAARAFDPPSFAIEVAIVAVLSIAANLAAFGSSTALVRLLPSGSITARSLVVGAVTLSCLSAAVIATAFILTEPLWDRRHDTVVDAWPFVPIFFVLACVARAAVIVGKHALVGLGQPRALPILTAAMSALQFIGLFTMVALDRGQWSILVAAGLPAFVVLPVLMLLVRRALARGAATQAHDEPTRTGPTATTRMRTWATIAPIAGSEQLANLFRLLAVDGLVVFVHEQSHDGLGAHLFVALAGFTVLNSLTSASTTALLTHAADRMEMMPTLLNRSLRATITLVTPTAILLALFAEPLLRPLGRSYSSDGLAVFRLLALASIAHIGIGFATTVARLRNRGSVIVVISLLSLIPSWTAAWFADTSTGDGLVVVGIAMLAGHSVLAVLLLVTSLRSVVVDHLRGPLLTSILSIRERHRQRHRQRHLEQLFGLLSPSNDNDPLTGATADGEIHMQIDHIHDTHNDVAVARVIRRDETMMLKIALSDEAGVGLRQHADILREVAADQTLRWVPEVVEQGFVDGHVYVIEERIAGQPLGTDAAAQRDGLRQLHTFHQQSTRSARLEQDDVQRIALRHVDSLDRTVGSQEHRAGLLRLRNLVTETLTDRTSVVALTHGDCWAGNMLGVVGDDGWTMSALVDWETGDRCGLPDVDLAHFCLFAQPDAVAGAVCDAIEGSSNCFLDGLHGLGLEPHDPELPADIVVVLAWLQHVGWGIARSDRFAPGRLWVDTNVKPVLDALARASSIRSNTAAVSVASMTEVLR